MIAGLNVAARVCGKLDNGEAAERKSGKYNSTQFSGFAKTGVEDVMRKSCYC